VDSKWTVLKINFRNRKTQIKSESRLQNAGYCKLLLTYRRMMCVSAVACSGSVQVLYADPVSHIHTVRYRSAIYSTYVQGKMLASLRTQCCSGETTMHSVLFHELDDIFNFLNKWRMHNNAHTENFLRQ
jgi:hypothetical protein